MTKFTIDIVDDYTAPEGPLETDEAYLEFVMNAASESYRNQYEAATKVEGVTAARAAYNAALPVQTEEVIAE